MLIKFLPLLLVILLSACSVRQSIEVIPYAGISITLPSAENLRIESNEGSLIFYDENGYLAEITTINDFSQVNSLEFIREGLRIAESGNYPVKILEFGSHRVGFTVTVEGYTTLYFADPRIKDRAFIVSADESNIDKIITKISN